MLKVETYQHYSDIQLLNHLTNALRTESSMSAESLSVDVEDVQQRWNKLLTGIADRQVAYSVRSVLCEVVYCHRGIVLREHGL